MKPNPWLKTLIFKFRGEWLWFFLSEIRLSYHIIISIIPPSVSFHFIFIPFQLRIPEEVELLQHTTGIIIIISKHEEIRRLHAFWFYMNNNINY